MLTIIFDKNSHLPLYEQLYSFIREKIENNQLKPNEKMPSKRKLAEHLQISTITVQNAYSQLIAEGYLRSLAKRGYYVENIDAENISFKNRQNKKDQQEIEKAEDGKIWEREDLNKYTYNMKTNGVDIDFFPFATWSKIARRVLNENSRDILNISHPQGLWQLRQEIAVYLDNYRNISISPHQIVLGAGSEYLMSILIQLLGRKSIYAVENPGYQKIYSILEDNNVGIRPIPLDSQGLNIDKLRISDSNIVHISPSHQFPTGIVMPIARRRALLNWAEESRDRYIIESDYDSEFRFSGNPIPACQGLDTSGKVIYLNTFTKTLAPSLRISYLVLPPDLLAVYQEKFKDYSCTVPNFEQYILSEFIKGGYFERHLHRMSKIYRQKRDTLIDLIKNSPLKDKIEFLGSNAGLHLLLQVDLGLSEKELIALAAENSVRVYGLSEYYYDKSLGDRYDKHIIIIGYSGLSLEDIQAGGQLLTEAWLKGK